MRTKVKKQKMLKMFESLLPVMNDPSLNETLNHIYFRKGEVSVYNEQVFILSKFKEFSFTGAINSSPQIVDLLRKTTNKYFEIAFDAKKERLKIFDENFNLKIKVNSKIPFLKIKIPEEQRFQAIPNNFIYSLVLSDCCCGQNTLESELRNVFISKNIILSCDNFRAAEVKMDGEIEGEMTLSKSLIGHIIKFNPLRYVIDGQWVYFTRDFKTILAGKMSQGKYPKHSVLKLFKKRKETTEIHLPDKIKEIVDRVQTIVHEQFEQDEFIDLKFSNGSLICIGKGTLGQVKEILPLDYKDRDIEIQIHPKLFLEALHHLLVINIEKSKVHFKGENFNYVISVVGSKGV